MSGNTGPGDDVFAVEREEEMAAYDRAPVWARRMLRELMCTCPSVAQLEQQYPQFLQDPGKLANAIARMNAHYRVCPVSSLGPIEPRRRRRSRA